MSDGLDAYRNFMRARQEQERIRQQRTVERDAAAMQTEATKLPAEPVKPAENAHPAEAKPEE